MGVSEGYRSMQGVPNEPDCILLVTTIILVDLYWDID